MNARINSAIYLPARVGFGCRRPWAMHARSCRTVPSRLRSEQLPFWNDLFSLSEYQPQPEVPLLLAFSRSARSKHNPASKAARARIFHAASARSWTAA